MLGGSHSKRQGPIDHRTDPTKAGHGTCFLAKATGTLDLFGGLGAVPEWL